ncbi:hypothetical protein ABPG74_018034 [Tetrahymena malaccensis]
MNIEKGISGLDTSYDSLSPLDIGDDMLDDSMPNDQIKIYNLMLDEVDGISNEIQVKDKCLNVKPKFYYQQPQTSLGNDSTAQSLTHTDSNIQTSSQSNLSTKPQISEQGTQSLSDNIDPIRIQGKWDCAECKQKCSSQGVLINHVKDQHENIKRGQKFQGDLRKYLNHEPLPIGRPKGSKKIQKQDKSKNYQCSCGKSYSQIGSLNTHITKQKMKNTNTKCCSANPKKRGRPSKCAEKKVAKQKEEVGRPTKLQQQQSQI